MAVRNRFAELQSEITEWRQDIHQHPELMFDTHRTSRKVAELLKEFGCDSVETGIGRTGVVGVIHGQSTQSGKVVGLRADMDALPIHEATGLDYSSRNEGKMHACGHDGHTSMLLGAAKYLAETRNFDGTAVVIFQPAEEGGGGGKEMIEDGMMDRFDIQEVYGMHNMPGMSPGKIRHPAWSVFCCCGHLHNHSQWHWRTWSETACRGRSDACGKSYRRFRFNRLFHAMLIRLNPRSSQFAPSKPIPTLTMSFPKAHCCAAPSGPLTPKSANCFSGALKKSPT